MPTPEALVKTLLHGKSSQTRRFQRATRESCDLCFLPLGPGEKELIERIGKHSLDFSSKPYRCDDCQIGFAFFSDLQLHYTVAAKGQCGFRFVHYMDTSKDESTCCTGHHPPSINKLVYDDHKQMQETLWAWENCQLRAHRTTIARLLAERLHYTQESRHSIANDELSRIVILSRLNIASIDSFRSAPACVKYRDRMDLDDLDAEFNNLAMLQNETSDQTSQDETLYRARARPESTVLGTGASGMLDFKMEWEGGQLKPVLRKTSTSHPPRSISDYFQQRSTSLHIKIDPAGSKSTDTDQLRTMRAPAGIKTRASGVRYRAKVATRYFLPINRNLDERASVQYVRAAVA